MNTDNKIITNVFEIDIDKWRKFVASHKNGNIFQMPEMFNVFKMTQNYEPLIVSVLDENKNILGILVAVIQKEYSSFLGNFTARSIVWGGPLVSNNSPMILQEILRAYNRIVGKKAIYSQFRNLWAQTEEEKMIFYNFKFHFENHLNIIVELKKAKEELFQNLHSSKRRQIRKAYKLNVSIHEIVKEHELKYLYYILKDLYRKKVKKPLPPLNLFLNLFFILNKQNMIKVFAVKYHDKIIGGIICPISFKKTIYEFYICSDDKFKKLYPSVLATWAAIKWGCENGVSKFDFLGAGKPNTNYGVRDFKLKFGGRLVNYGRYEKINRPFLMQLGKSGLKIWQYLKQ